MALIVFVRKTEEYRVSKTGKTYRRKSVKRKIRCPLCPSSTQWLSRHLRDVHKLNSDDTSRLLASTDSYRRRKPDCWKKRVPCPFPECMTRITCISGHLRRVHETTLTALRLQARAASPDIVPPSPRNSFSRLLIPGTSAIHDGVDNNTSHIPQSVVACARTAPLQSMAEHDDHDDDDVTTAGALRSCSQVQLLSAHSSHTWARTAPQQSVVNDDDDDDDSWHSDVETSSHDLFDYTSDNNMLPEDQETTQDTDVSNIIPAYTTHLSSVDGGLKARPEMYGIAVKQIINAVGNTMENLTKENVASQYVEKMMNVVSHKTLRNKLRSLEYFCAYIIDVLFTYPNSDVSNNIIQNLTTLKNVFQTGERH